MRTEGPGIERENGEQRKSGNTDGRTRNKKRKNENAHCRTWNMVRKLKITENEKYKFQDVKFGEENCKVWKIQKCPLQDVEYGKKPENHGK